MKFTLEFNMDTAAFEVAPAKEASRILSKVSAHLAAGKIYGKITDIGDNIVGQWVILEDRSCDLKAAIAKAEGKEQL